MQIAFITLWSGYSGHQVMIKRLNVTFWSHPDLAGKLAQRGELTIESTNEQKSAGLNQLTPDEFAEFKYLNTTYMINMVPVYHCSEGTNKNKNFISILKKRVNNSKTAEFNEACLQVEKIAYIRIRDIID